MTAQQTQNNNDIFEGNVSVGPLNPVLRPVTIKDTPDIKPNSNQAFALDYNIIDVEKQVLEEGKFFPVTISIGKERGMLDVALENRTLTIQYALPEGLAYSSNYTLEEARLNFTTLNGPSGIQKEIEIIDQNTLDTAFFWGTRAIPFSYQTENKLRVVQKQVSTNSVESGYIPVPLYIIADEKEIQVTLGKSTPFSYQGKKYIAYALESSFLIDPNNGGCTNGGYIIRCVISKAFSK